MAGVDLTAMIGEFHCDALDAGLMVLGWRLSRDSGSCIDAVTISGGRFDHEGRPLNLSCC